MNARPKKATPVAASPSSKSCTRPTRVKSSVSACRRAAVSVSVCRMMRWMRGVNTEETEVESIM